MKRLLTALAAVLAVAHLGADDGPVLSVDHNAPTLSADPGAEMIADPIVGGGASQRPEFSFDGKMVIFDSTARLTSDDTDRLKDVYVYDRTERTYRRLHRPAGAYGSGGATLSGDGTHVAYHVHDVQPRQGVEPQASILLVHLASGNTRRIPQPWRGESVKGEAFTPQIGRRASQMIFTSNGPGLSGRAASPIRQVYLFDRASDEIRLISRSVDGFPANRLCAEPRLSENGRFAAFLSAATNLGPPLPSDALAMRLYVVDRTSGTTTRIDEIERGIDPSIWIVDGFDMDADGENIVIEARERKRGKPHDSLAATDLFLYERSSGTVTRITSGIFAGRSHSPAISANGRWTVFSLTPAKAKKESGGLVVYDRERDLWRTVAGGRCLNPAISGDGRWIAFDSADRGVTGDKKGTSRIFILLNPSYEDENAGG